MTDGAAEVFDSILTRVAALPPDQLDPLILRRTTGTLLDALQIEMELQALAPVVEQLLYDGLPGLGSRELRREALRVKRDVHNLRSGQPGPWKADLLQRLPPTTAELVERWQRISAARDERLTAAKSAFLGEREQASTALMTCMDDPELQAGLALASPALLQSLLGRSTHLPQSDSRLARSCFLYLVRVTLKTSPLTTFTRIGLSSFAGTPPPPSSDAPRSIVRLNRAVATSLLFAFAQHPQLAPAFSFRANPGLREQQSLCWALLPDYRNDRGFFWRSDAVYDADLYRHLVRMAQKIDSLSYRECLDRLETDDPHSLLVRLVVLQLVRPVAPWPRHARWPLAFLAAALEGLGAPFPSRIAALLRGMERAQDEIQRAGAQGRLYHTGEMRTALQDVMAATAQPLLCSLDNAPLVYEDAMVSHPLPLLPQTVRRDLQQLGNVLRSYVLCNPLYDVLVDHFVGRYGSAGSCDDVLGFLVDFCRRPDFGEVLTQTATVYTDTTETQRQIRARRPVGRGCSPPTTSVFFQLAAASREAVERGEYLLVVNQCSSGSSGHFWRFAPLWPEESGFADDLTRWLMEMYRGAQVLEVPVCADWSTLHPELQGRLPALEWPAEWPVRDDSNRVTLQDLRLVHNPARNALDWVDRSGKVMAPKYLGVMPAQLVTGPLRLLLTLADPWVNTAEVGIRPGDGQAQSPPRQLEFHRRLTEDRLVLRRAYWRVPAGEFPVQSPREEAWAYLERVQRWRLRCGIPAEVWVRREQHLWSTDPDLRKPMWLRFDALHALQAVGKALADASPLRLEEALPSMEECWVAGPDGRARAAEFVALLRWPSSE